MVSRYLEYFKMILYLTIFSVYFTHATMLSSTVPMTALINNKDEHSNISSLQRSKAENSNNNIKLTSISTASTTPRYTMTGFGYNNDELVSTKQRLFSTTSISSKIEMQRGNQIRTSHKQDSTKAIDWDYKKHNDWREIFIKGNRNRDSHRDTEDEINRKYYNIFPTVYPKEEEEEEAEDDGKDTGDKNGIKHAMVVGIGIVNVMIVLIVIYIVLIKYDVRAKRCNDTVTIADVNYINSQEEQELECIDMKSFDSSSHPDDDYVPEDIGFTYEDTFSQPHSYQMNYSDESDYRVEYGIKEETKYEHFTYN